MAVQADWYVVAVAPQAEASVHKRSTELGIPAYFPTGLKVVKRRRHTVVMEPRQTAAMPGYVFVQAAEGRFGQYRRYYDSHDAVPHCLGWLRGRDGPEPVSQQVVDDLKKRAADGKFDTVEAQGRYWAPRWLRRGRSVLITEGPLEGSTGRVSHMVAARRVALWVVAIGGETLTDLPIDWISHA